MLELIALEETVGGLPKETLPRVCATQVTVGARG
jgi:hypothetical protein